MRSFQVHGRFILPLLWVYYEDYLVILREWTRKFLFIRISLFPFRISSMVTQTSLLLSLVRLLAIFFCLRIKSWAIYYTKCLDLLFVGGMIVFSFCQLFLLMIFSFLPIIFCWGYHLETGIRSGQDWWGKGKKVWKMKVQASQKWCTSWLLLLIVEKCGSILLSKIMLRSLLWCRK